MNAELRWVIEGDRLLCHPSVIGELALGSLRDRRSVLLSLRLSAKRSSIDRHGIFSMGIGYTDAHLLASVLLERRAALWTRDKRLRAAAEKAGAALHIPVDRSH
nr:type II toxin-antitoxin system VapC family toxin [Rhizobium ruizarguesonis]